MEALYFITIAMSVQTMCSALPVISRRSLDEPLIRELIDRPCPQHSAPSVQSRTNGDLFVSPTIARRFNELASAVKDIETAYAHRLSSRRVVSYLQNVTRDDLLLMSRAMPETDVDRAQTSTASESDLVTMMYWCLVYVQYSDHIIQDENRLVDELIISPSSCLSDEMETIIQMTVNLICELHQTMVINGMEENREMYESLTALQYLANLRSSEIYIRNYVIAHDFWLFISYSSILFNNV